MSPAGRSPGGGRGSSARTVVLDSQAVSALAHGARGMAERLEAALRLDARVVVPAVVLAEVMTGEAADASVWNVVRRLPVVDLDTRLSARAGGLRERAEAARRKKRDLTLDALVAAVAVQVQPAVVVTSDAEDLALLVDGYDVKVSAVDRPRR